MGATRAPHDIPFRPCFVRPLPPPPYLSCPAQIVALGRGRWPKAEAAIEEARKSGGWVFLANCHLDIRNMASLEKILDEMNSIGGQKRPHRDFRLWLSSNPQEVRLAAATGPALCWERRRGA